MKQLAGWKADGFLAGGVAFFFLDFMVTWLFPSSHLGNLANLFLLPALVCFSLFFRFKNKETLKYRELSQTRFLLVGLTLFGVWLLWACVFLIAIFLGWLSSSAWSLRIITLLISLPGFVYLFLLLRYFIYRVAGHTRDGRASRNP